ncbi:hypothetical protein CYB_0787 [Synechococcus sp. JA-2-3B'a(2-13)]|nr:hypothetical protein CYB_0787 [Synechococcus sp. JA-2-3B'a(2-13)]
MGRDPSLAIHQAQLEGEDVGGQNLQSPALDKVASEGSSGATLLDQFAAAAHRLLSLGIIHNHLPLIGQAEAIEIGQISPGGINGQIGLFGGHTEGGASGEQSHLNILIPPIETLQLGDIDLEIEGIAVTGKAINPYLVKANGKLSFRLSKPLDGGLQDRLFVEGGNPNEVIPVPHKGVLVEPHTDVGIHQVGGRARAAGPAESYHVPVVGADGQTQGHAYFQHWPRPSGNSRESRYGHGSQATPQPALRRKIKLRRARASDGWGSHSSLFNSPAGGGSLNSFPAHSGTV